MADTPDQPSQTIIERLFDSLATNGIEASLDNLVAPDALFIGVREQPSDHVPIYGTYRGHNEIPNFFGTLRSLFDTQHFEIHHAIEQGDIAMATGVFHHRVKATGKDFHSHWACFCTKSDGKIKSYRFYEDTAALEAALSPSL